uniref:Reverse transcriptase domain-containing protein n=1 Tax=Esox lucius TaxID=8010 RepID=A0AAY5K2T0_ESOLU
MFSIFMDRISRRSQGPEGVRFGDHTISSLLFADDVVVLAPSSQDLQHALGRFAAESEAVGMKISTSKPKAMVLCRKRVACPLQKVGLEFYIDVHAHSTMMNGFMYGNVFEEEERVQRQAVFPRLLCNNAADFSFSNTSFNRDMVKAGTGRRFLGGLLDDTSYCYTLEVSFYSYMAAGSTAPVPYTEDTYMKLGRNVARTFLDYYKHNHFIDENKAQIPSHINSIEVLSKDQQGNGNRNGRSSGGERAAERKSQGVRRDY